ncbi:hypothetical protein [Leptospira sp. GIMC2001]|uniref:hypothetical protein n=1 Tax=Leptospira sp. GIMC2001 TaxID=1513297 RepID=UPI00234A3954|nr:hypothetical protein [Leptospira sp. GIMC2001]WCL50484.1 hypothetical protein O4O04_06590 [Leptospira sp. GIMC2001]
MDRNFQNFQYQLIPIICMVFISMSCASGNLFLKIEENSSGSLQFLRKEINDRKSISPNFIKGGKGEELDFQITSLDVKFSEIQNLGMDGSDFIWIEKFENGKNHYCLLFTLDTSKDSAWFKYFNISSVSLKKFQNEAMSRDDLARFNNLTDHVVWEISLPGEIISVKDYEPLGPDWWISIQSGRKAILKIPAIDILNSRRKFSTYEVCSSVRHKSN